MIRILITLPLLVACSPDLPDYHQRFQVGDFVTMKIDNKQAIVKSVNCRASSLDSIHGCSYYLILTNSSTKQRTSEDIGVILPSQSGASIMLPVGGGESPPEPYVTYLAQDFEIK